MRGPPLRARWFLGVSLPIIIVTSIDCPVILLTAWQINTHTLIYSFIQNNDILVETRSNRHLAQIKSLTSGRFQALFSGNLVFLSFSVSYHGLTSFFRVRIERKLLSHTDLSFIKVKPTFYHNVWTIQLSKRFLFEVDHWKPCFIISHRVAHVESPVIPLT